MDNVPMEAPLTFERCFTCNQLTPPQYMRVVILDSTETTVCLACYRKLQKRVQDLEIELQKQKEEEEFDETEAEEAFGSTESEED